MRPRPGRARDSCRRAPAAARDSPHPAAHSSARAASGPRPASSTSPSPGHSTCTHRLCQCTGPADPKTFAHALFLDDHNLCLVRLCVLQACGNDISLIRTLPAILAK